MKTMKKLLALVLALTMVFALSATAFAADTTPPGNSTGDSTGDKKPDGPGFTITIDNEQNFADNEVSIKGKLFTAYKIFDVSYDGDQYTYLFIDALKNANPRVEITSGGVTYWGDREMNPPDSKKDPADTSLLAYLESETPEELNTPEAIKFASYIMGRINSTGAEKINVTPIPLQMDADKEKQTFEVNDPGYYLITGSGTDKEGNEIAAGITLTTTDNNATFNPKLEPLTLDKKAKGEHVLDDDGKAAEAEVGKTVTYDITTNVPDMTGYATYILKVTDEMTDGLTFDPTSVVVTFKHGTDDAVTAPVSDENNADNYMAYQLVQEDVNSDEIVDDEDNKGASFYINFPNIIKAPSANYDDVITVTYSAKVNGTALNYNWERNTANIEYGRDPGDLNSSTPKKVNVYSFDIEINKYWDNPDVAGNEKTPLEGAQFVLRRVGEKDVEGVKVPCYEYYRFHAADEAGNTTGDPYITWDNTIDAPNELNPDGSIKVKHELDHKEYLSKDITIWTTGADGKATFESLEEGVYELVEVKAPDGFNLKMEPTEVTIEVVDAENPKEPSLVKINGVPVDENRVDRDSDVAITVESEIENKFGKLLPTTGGMGTTLFYVIGSIMMIGAAVILVAKKRTSI